MSNIERNSSTNSVLSRETVSTSKTVNISRPLFKRMMNVLHAYEGLAVTYGQDDDAQAAGEIRDDIISELILREPPKSDKEAV